MTKDIAESVANDPWGKAYMLRVLDPKTRRFQIVSAGPDGKFGSRDDVHAGN